MRGPRKRESKIALLLAACLFAAAGFGLLLDRYRTVSSVVEGEAEDVDLLITELCAKNASIIEDPNGKHADYIELYNRGEDCNLRGFTISDGKTTSEPFGDMPFAAGEYKVIFISKDTTGFSLSAAGDETITLRNRDGTIAAQVTTVSMLEDQVMSWHGGGYELTNRATPGFPNTDAGYQAFTVGEPDENPAVTISELLLANRGVLPDENGRFCDAVELHNLTNAPLSLGGYYLSDGLENRFRYALPSVTLPADGYVVVFCDSDSAFAENLTQPHASFGLSEGETAVLTAPNGKYVSVPVPTMPDNRSLSLINGTYVESAVSMGFSNDETGELAFLNSRINAESPLVINEVLLAEDGTPCRGMLCDAVEIRNRSNGTVDTAGWYLSDAANPLRYALPSRELAPGECLILFCDRQSGEWHTGFGLSVGETLRLTGPDYRHSEPVTCISAGDGCSLVREEDGDEVFYRPGVVSMGYENTEEGRAQFLTASNPTGLQISEVLTSNSKYLLGPYGTSCDWVELYNASNESINLSGWYLSDDPDNLRKGALPNETIAPGEYYIAFLSKNPKNLLTGYPVMPFGLAASGDRLYLSREVDGQCNVADSVVIPALPVDTSYGRPAGKTEFAVLATVTPGAANSSSAAPTSAAPTAVTAQGVYNDVASLDVILSGAGTIFYTTDCSEPTLESNVYNGSIHLTKTTVIRAICYESGKTPSSCVDLTYLLNEGHTLPVASLVTTPANLWDYNTGIYVSGPGASATYPYLGSNFWKSWEKEATVSLYETDGSGFSSPCGLRIFGGYSRALDMKSFSCFFRASYGNSSLEYPLFGDAGLDSYESFIFRNTGQDFSLARMRDPMLTELLSSKTDVAVQKNRPVVLYLNGEFWGVYYIREKINENYVAGNYHVRKDQVDLVFGNGNSSRDYQNLMSYVRSHNLSDAEAYEYVASQMNIDEYIDYIVAEIYIGNYDNGNIKFFRAEGGKWTWICYDVDQSFYNSDLNTVSEHLNRNGTGAADMYSTDLINGLLKNTGFRDQFFRRFAWQIENVWTPERVIAAIDAYEQRILPEMERDGQKWGRSITAWQRSVNVLRDFANERPGKIVSMLKAYFSFSDAELKNYGFNV